MDRSGPERRNALNTVDILDSAVRINGRFLITERELRQFKNLKKMTVFGSSRDTAGLKKMCGPLGIEVEPLAVTVE